MSNLNVGDWIDVVALFALAWGFGRGFFRGPFREVLSVVGTVVAFVVAVTLYQPAYVWSGFDFRTGSQSLGYLSWFLILLAGTVVVFRLIDLGVRKFTDKTGGLGLSSRLWGGGIGASKSAFLVVLGALFFAAMPLSILGQSHPVIDEARGSRTMRFAEGNRWVVRWIGRTNLVDGIRSYVLDGTSAAMAEALVPGRDPEIRDRARRAFHLLLEEPERIAQLGESPTVRELEPRFDSHPGLQELLRNSPAVAEAEADGRITLAEVKTILSTEEEAIARLLEDPSFRELLLSVDLDRIASELPGSDVVAR